MDFSNKKQAFLYLDRNKFDFFASGNANILSFSFPATSVKDLEIINSAELETKVQQFIQQYGISPSNIAIVLSPDIVFEKEISADSKETDTQKFLDSVPFENIISINIPVENKPKVIAANKNFCEVLQSSFSPSGSVIESVIPYVAFGQDAQLLKSLNVESSTTILKRIEGLKTFNMIQKNTEIPQVQKKSTNETQNKKPTNKPRLYAMIGFFVVLLLILGFLLFKK